MENKDVNAKSGGDFSDTLFSSFVAGDALTEILINPKREATKIEDILKRTEYLVFNKPDAELFNPSLLYEIILEDEARQITGVLSVIKRTTSRFQPRCDIVFVTKEGETLLRLINPKRLVHKVKVLIGDKVVGSIIKSRLNIFGPKYRLRDADKKEIATVTSTRKYCCLTCQKLCSGADFGVFQVIRKVRHQFSKTKDKTVPDKNKNIVAHSTSLASIASNGDQLLGVICRDVTFNDRAGHAAIMEITFENTDLLETRMKCLMIAAAIFIDFSVFVPQAGQADVKVIIAVGIILALLAGMAWVVMTFT